MVPGDDLHPDSSLGHTSNLVVLEAAVDCQDDSLPRTKELWLPPRDDGHEVLLVDVFELEGAGLVPIDNQLKLAVFPFPHLYPPSPSWFLFL